MNQLDLNHGQMKDLQKMFQGLDKNNDGKLDITEIISTMQQNGMTE
jgi:Ca2+-binding EF-hand superfamily protein